MFLTLTTPNYDELVQKYQDNPEDYWPDKQKELESLYIPDEDIENLEKRLEALVQHELVQSTVNEYNLLDALRQYKNDNTNRINKESDSIITENDEYAL